MARRPLDAVVPLFRVELKTPWGCCPAHGINPGITRPGSALYFGAVQKFTPRPFSEKTSRAMSSASPFQLPLKSPRSSSKN